MSSEDFKIGDMVWAKMKGFPPWPAKIVEDVTSSGIKPTKIKKHYVCFFGTNDHAWILDENITLHNKSFLESTKKYKSSKYDHAITEFLKELESLNKRSSRIKNKIENSADAPAVKGRKLSTSPRIKRQQKMEPSHTRKRSRHDSSKRQSSDSASKSRKLQENASAVGTQLSLNGTNELQEYNFKLKYEKLLHYLCELKKKQILKKDCPSQKRFGFIGQGPMGEAIAENIVESGHDITIWTKTTSECIPLVQIGAKQAQSPAELIANCDVTFCCMSTPDVKEVIFGDDGVLKGFEQTKERKSYVEMSSIDTETSRSIKEAINTKGGLYLEASLCGKVADAKANQLLIVASGDKEVFDECESVFHVISKRSSYMTPEVGVSSVFALCMKTCMSKIEEVIEETLVLEEKSYAEKDLFIDYLFSGPLCVNDIVERRQVMQHRTAVSAVTMRRNLQDMNNVLDLAKKKLLAMPITEVTAAIINGKLAG